MDLSPKVIKLVVATNIVTLAALAFVLTTGFRSESTHFEELTTQRINIVSPKGETVIAISNKERIAPPVMGGKRYPLGVSEGREHLAGMIFFNQEGDEMGGLVFNSFKLPNGKNAGIGHLSFDRYSDNQVIALQYKENKNLMQAGLTFYDRPANGNFKKALDLIEEKQVESPTPERMAEIVESFGELKKDNGLGVERVFIGSKNQIPQLLLNDQQGRVRARLVLDDDGKAKLEFLDEKGLVTAHFPK